jgi:hypothetical protein
MLIEQNVDNLSIEVSQSCHELKCLCFISHDFLTTGGDFTGQGFVSMMLMSFLIDSDRLFDRQEEFKTKQRKILINF